MRTMIVIAGLLSACAGGPAPDNGTQGGTPGPAEAMEAELNAPGHVVAQIGETAQLGNVSVRPIAVVEDSRCPIDVTCVWAGRLTVRVAISGVEGTPDMEMGRAFILPNQEQLTLVAAMPPRWHQPAPDIERDAPYRFAFRRGADIRRIME